MDYAKNIKQKAYNLLRLSEKYTQTDMVYLAKGGAFLSLGQIGGILLGFILTISYANLLTPENYGFYKYILTVAGIISAFGLTGINTATIQSVSRGYEGVVRYGQKLSWRWNQIMVAISLIGVGYYAWNKNYQIAIAYLIMAVSLPIINSFNYAGLINGKKDFSASAKYQFFRNAIPTAILLISVIFTHNPLILLAIYFIAQSATVIIQYNIALNKYRPNNKLDQSVIKYAKHLSLIAFGNNVASRLDNLLIFHLLGAAPLAFYSIASAIPDQIIGMSKNLYILALPKFSQHDKFKLKEKLLSKTIIFGLAGLVSAVAYIIISPILFKLFFIKYEDAIFISRLISLNIFLATLGTIPATYLDSQIETKKKYTVSFLSNTTKTILMLVLIIPYGVIGLVAAELITRAITILLSLFLIYKKEPHLKKEYGSN